MTKRNQARSRGLRKQQDEVFATMLAGMDLEECLLAEIAMYAVVSVDDDDVDSAWLSEVAVRVPSALGRLLANRSRGGGS